jgi:hypothetical protein
MNMKYGRALMALVVLLATVGPVAADTKWSQISWYTAISVAHSIVYGIYNNTVACSQTALYYVETPPINGIENKINATTDQTGQFPCQNASQGAFKIQNDGSVGLNVSATFNQITTGVRPKIGGANAAWETTCSGTCTSADCALSANCIMLNTNFQQVAYNIPQNSSKEYWLWADFKGVAGTAAPTKGNLTTNATKA